MQNIHFKLSAASGFDDVIWRHQALNNIIQAVAAGLVLLPKDELGKTLKRMKHKLNCTIHILNTASGFLQTLDFQAQKYLSGSRSNTSPWPSPRNSLYSSGDTLVWPGSLISWCSPA